MNYRVAHLKALFFFEYSFTFWYTLTCCSYHESRTTCQRITNNMSECHEQHVSVYQKVKKYSKKKRDTFKWVTLYHELSGLLLSGPPCINKTITCIYCEMRFRIINRVLIRKIFPIFFISVKLCVKLFNDFWRSPLGIDFYQI